MQFSPFYRHLIPLPSKYPPQHPVLKHPQSVFLTPDTTAYRNAVGYLPDYAML
jgi:hypothetical protein